MLEKIITIPKILSKREKIILFSTIGIIVFGLAFNFILEPFWKKNESLNNEISLSRRKLKKYAQLLSQKEYIQNKFNKLSDNMKSSEVGEALLEIAKASNIRIIDIRPQQGQKLQGKSSEKSVEVRTEGNTEDYVRFLYNIENSLYLLRIKRFQLNAKANAQTLEGTFSISQISLE